MSKTQNNTQTETAEKTFRQNVADYLKKLWRFLLRKETDSSLRDAIEELIEEDDEEEASINTDEKLILGNVLNLRDLTAEDVMIPYANIIAAPLTATQDDFVSCFVKANVSQIPIYSGTIDNIVGLLSLKDALSWLHSKKLNNIKSILREVLFIAPTMRTLDLLLQMRETGVRMAVVVDEYGGVDGIVTFATLIEEIIGDIQYAQDLNNEEHIEILNGAITLNATTPLEELDEAVQRLSGSQINWLEGLDDGEDVDTIGGLVTFIAGRVPLRGELIIHPLGFEFEILEADPRRVKKISIRKLLNISH